MARHGQGRAWRRSPRRARVASVGGPALEEAGALPESPHRRGHQSPGTGPVRGGCCARQVAPWVTLSARRRRDLVPRVAVRRQPGDRPLQPRGTRVPEAAPLHVPGGQRHGLRPVSGPEAAQGREQGCGGTDALRGAWR